MFTARYNTKAFRFMPAEGTYVLYIVFRKKEVTSLYNITRFVFITEIFCVYCAVRTASLRKLQDNLCFQSVNYGDWAVRFMPICYVNDERTPAPV
jgi:hypothetical protein